MSNNLIANKTTEEKGSVKLVLEGELTLANASEIKNIFSESANEYEKINISLKNIKSIDLSFVQLLKSLKNNTLKNKKKLEIDYDLSQNILELLNNSGINLKKIIE